MTTIVAPKPTTSTRTSSYDYRVLYLSGKWELPGRQLFRLRATIFIQNDGAATGSIYWQAFQISGLPASFFATEKVSGSILGNSVELQGLAVESGLLRDLYKISLSGDDDAGVFGGISRAFGDWAGRMEGKYRFVNRKK